MRFVILLFVLWTAQIISASGSFYFVTNSIYTVFGINATVISSNSIKGDSATVTQQCRRTCAQSLSCKAYQVTLLQGVAARGIFNCSFYDLNACDYRNTSLKQNMGRGRMWDKLDATLLNPKVCIFYCGVLNKGNCSRCIAGSSNFTGLDCEIAPKLCSDYTATPNTLTLFPIWPWGFRGRKLTVLCIDRETVIIRNSFTTGVRTVLSLGFNTTVATSLPIYTTAIQNTDWSLISELQSLSTEKKLFVRVTLDISLTENHIFSGLEISPTGELSLNASLTGSTGFPTPLSKARFVNSPIGYGFDCGPFWQFSTAYVCYQRTKLLNYGNFVWDGQTSIGLGSVVLSFK